MVALLSLSAPADPLRVSGLHYVGVLPTLVTKREILHEIYGSSGRDNLQSPRAREIDFALTAMTPLVFDALANFTRGAPNVPMIFANLSNARPMIHLMLLDAGDAAPVDARCAGEPSAFHTDRTGNTCCTQSPVSRA